MVNLPAVSPMAMYYTLNTDFPTEHSTMALPDVSKDIEARLVDSERCDTVARGENVVSGASASCVSDMRV